MQKRDSYGDIRGLKEAIHHLDKEQLVSKTQEAKQWASQKWGVKRLTPFLFTKNHKLSKSGRDQNHRWDAWGLELASGSSGGFVTCPFAHQQRLECLKYCLRTAGHGVVPVVRESRIKRTRMLFDRPDLFASLLFDGIDRLNKRAKKQGRRLAFRLNVLSDIPWWDVMPSLFTELPDVQFYDYTKEALPATKISNYNMTYSFHEQMSMDRLLEILNTGHNVAVVFNTKWNEQLPGTYQGFTVVDGDLDDFRFMDPSPSIVGLRAKGFLRSKESKFLVKTESEKENGTYPSRDQALPVQAIEGH